MQTRRIYLAGVILGATLIVAVWLLTYRVWDVVEYIGLDGRHFHPSEHVRTQPWWSVPATTGGLLIGGGLSVRLLPGHRGLLRRFADYFAELSREHPSSKPGS